MVRHPCISHLALARAKDDFQSVYPHTNAVKEKFLDSQNRVGYYRLEMLRFLVIACLFIQSAHAVKFWTQVVPATAGVTTCMVNAGTIWRGFKKTPKVLAATPKGPGAMVKAAKSQPAKGPTK